MKEFRNIYELLDSESFRTKSPMYMGEKSISKLRVYMDGYHMCEVLNGLHSDTFPSFWLFFHWIKKKYKHNGSYHYWDGIILLNCDHNEEKAFDTFLDLFDEFREVQIIKSVKASVAEKSIAFFNSAKNKTKRFRIQDGQQVRIGPAKEIVIVAYSHSMGCSIHQIKGNHLLVKKHQASYLEALESLEKEYGNHLEWEDFPREALQEVYEKINI